MTTEPTDTPEERGTIADTPSPEELEQYADHMEDRDIPQGERHTRSEGFEEGWTRAYYLTTNAAATRTIGHVLVSESGDDVCTRMGPTSYNEVEAERRRWFGVGSTLTIAPIVAPA